MGGDGERTRLCHPAWLKRWRKEPDVVRCPHKPSIPTHWRTTGSDFSLVWFCILDHAAAGVPFTRQWPLSPSSFMSFYVTDKWEHFRRDILLLFLSLSCTVQALDRQSSRKDVRESAKSRTVDDSSLTKEESKIFQRKLSHVKDHCVNMQCLVFESVSQSSTHMAASVPETGCLMLHPIMKCRKFGVIKQICWTVGRWEDTLLALQDFTVKYGDTARFLCVPRANLPLGWSRLTKVWW